MEPTAREIPSSMVHIEPRNAANTGRVPPPPPHVHHLVSAATIVAVSLLFIGFALSWAGLDVRWYGVFVAVVITLAVMGGFLLAAAFATRRRYINALLSWIAADPWTEDFAALVVALVSTGAHKEAATVLALRDRRSDGKDTVEDGNAQTPNTRTNSETNGSEPTDAEKREALINLLAMQDLDRWQGPSLAIAAQSFLLTIALGKDGTTTTRTIAAILGLATAFAALNLIWRKTLQVNELKTRLKSLKITNIPIERYESEHEGANPFSFLRPSLVWRWVLFVFMVFDVIIIVITFTNPSLFSAP